MMNCVIDWITFTKKFNKMQLVDNLENEIVEQIQTMLVPTCLIFAQNSRGWALGYGRFGYRSSLAHDGIEILFNGNQSVCVNISGQGCRTYESLHGDFDNLITEIVRNKYTVTRLDLAVDDRGDKTILDMQRIYKLSDMLYKDDKLSSSCKCWGEFRSINRIQGTDGTTVYYGSKSSDKCVKIYDKAAEQKLKEKWVRVELTLKNQYAFSALEFINFGVPAGEVFSGVMRNYLFF